MYLAEVRLAAGEIDLADRAIAKALEHSDAGTPLRPPALALYARIALARGHGDEALSLAEQAMQELASVEHVEDDEIGVHHALVSVLVARGEIDRAREAARVARDRLMVLAEKIRDDGYRATFLANVPAHREVLRMASELRV
jgi:ATP/maltotriose-dependent transcriptional regulator MalT